MYSFKNIISVLLDMIQINIKILKTGQVFLFLCTSLCILCQCYVGSNATPGPSQITVSTSPSPPPQTQVKLAEAVLWTKGSAVAGLSALSRLQLLPCGLCHPGGATADPGAAHRRQVVTM